MADQPKKTLQDIIREEYKKCLIDPVYFMKKYVKIQHPIRGTIPFDLYPFQSKTLQEFADNDFNIVLKSRQMGISTLVAAYSLWLMVFHKDKNVLIISIKQEVSKEIVSKVRFANDNLPSWMKVECKEDNRLSLKLANGSQIVAVSSAGTAGRSAALSLLILDECAFIEKAEEIWASAQPTLSTGGKAILLSCVTKDTFVFTNEGLQQVQDFINPKQNGGYEVDPYQVLGKDKLRKGNLFFNNGYQDTLCLKTKFSKLECTKNHKLWAYKNKTKSFAWVKSEDLELGDFLSIQIGMNIWGNYNDISHFNPSRTNKIKHPFVPTHISPELAYLFGLYIAEGSAYKIKGENGSLAGGSITITCGDDISWIFDKLGLSYNCWDGIHYTLSNKNLIELFEYVGFDLSLKANLKRIPKKLWKLNKENIRWMLRGIFDGDGCGTSKIVQLISTSSDLIDQVRLILLNFGIVSCITHRTKEKKNQKPTKIKHNHDSFILEISGRHALKFYNEVGFNLERKQINKEKLIKSNLNRSCSHDTIPNSIDLVKTLIQKSGLKGVQLKEKVGLFLNGYLNKKTKYKTQNISRQTVLYLYSLFGNLLEDDQKKYWNNVLSENVIWAEVTDITPSKNETFDFSLPDDNEDFWCHSVIYNGVIGHQTPNGIGNFFHKMWIQAEEGTSKFHPIKLPWNMHPERTEEWRKEQDRVSENLKKTAQELDCDFLSSGTTVIDLVLLDYFKKTFMRDPDDKRGINKEYWIWQYPIYSPDVSYIVAGDVARGDGEDYSAFHVLNAKTMEQCAEFKGHVSTKDFGNMLVAVATDYNDALLIVENAGPGWGTIQQILDRKYKNLFYSSNDLTYVDTDFQLTNRLGAEDKKLVPGFTTTLRTRPTIISNMCQYFVDKSISIYSKRLYSELETFVWDNGKPQAAKGYNDDLVMALCIGIWVRDTALRLQYERKQLTKSTLDHLTMTKTHEAPVFHSHTINAQNSWKMTVGPNKSHLGSKGEDLRWLLG